jgi:CDP-diacylglycerol--glycerol-3-phosphate 3-phosphatidyltransferase
MRWMVTPNKVTVLRMFVAGATVGLYEIGFRGNAAIPIGICALALTICAVALDGVDGYLARRLRMTSAIGAQLDILGDRVIENLFFVYFASAGQISVWVPVVFFVRGVLTDFLRAIAATRQPINGSAHTREFQRNWMSVERCSAKIVASRASRGTYAALKCVCFCALGVEWIARHAQNSFELTRWNTAIHASANTIVAATIAFCILRALPVFWEGLRDLHTDRRVNSGTIVSVARPITNVRWTS